MDHGAPAAGSHRLTHDAALRGVADPVSFDQDQHNAKEGGMRLRTSRQSEPGWSRVRRGKGFEFRDESGSRLTSAADLKRITDLVIPPAWSDVWICPWPNGHLQATGRDEAGRRQYLYHPDWTRKSSTVKFDRALELAKQLPAARAGVTKDLRTLEPTQSAVLAAGFRILDSALLRVGSERYAQEHSTVGLSTLRGSHVKVHGSSTHFAFRGKSSVPWESDVEDPDLAKFLGMLLDERGNRRRLLAWRAEGEWHLARAEHINADIQKRTGGVFTAKDFRTIHGTVIAALSLAHAGLARTKAARTRAIKEAVSETATALGNTIAVARSSYIDPRLWDVYEQGVVVDPRGRSVERQLIDLLGKK